MSMPLWQFLLKLLVEPGNEHIIKWLKPKWHFTLVNAEEVARKWGQYKGNNSMSYDKLSRSLRCYYEKGVIAKVPNQFGYKFTLPEDELQDFVDSVQGISASTRSSTPAASSIPPSPSTTASSLPTRKRQHMDDDDDSPPAKRRPSPFVGPGTPQECDNFLLYNLYMYYSCSLRIFELFNTFKMPFVPQTLMTFTILTLMFTAPPSNNKS